jgi:prepilin-type N-terminal cleavage/methylation domain-containing protein
MRRKRRRIEGGFTLIEVLIVVAVIGIIAAIALPSFIKMKTRSKTAVIASDFHHFRDQVYLYESDYNLVPPETGLGDKPPELDEYLGRQFTFKPELMYWYDWENWTGEDGNQDDGGTGVSKGFSVYTQDPDLGAALVQRFPNDLIMRQTQPDYYTFIIEKK